MEIYNIPSVPMKLVCEVFCQMVLKCATLSCRKNILLKNAESLVIEFIISMVTLYCKHYIPPTDNQILCFSNIGAIENVNVRNSDTSIGQLLLHRDRRISATSEEKELLRVFNKQFCFVIFVPRFCLILKAPITTGEGNTFCSIFLDCWQEIHMKYQAVLFLFSYN